ncbi:MAG: cysteine--tRNA ligase [Gemmatimonadota bacterium]|nr:cysteine--tRNA ligase [Gemmatimonadota bacterium]MDH5759643.1 cysteine--tRNA ligase [Gemmatimonadota bacterium]
MTLKVYNTLTRSLDAFRTLEEGKVSVYACGPTIYDFAHIGNFRAFLFYDLVHRYLEWSGYDVRFVMNLTDVDDKTIAGSVREGVDVRDFTARFGAAFLDDSEMLGVRRVDGYPKATEYVDPMIDFIERLMESGHAYRAEDGAVYFSIAKFPSYGKLKGIDPDTLRAGARVAQDEYDKEDARDFALWKVATEEDEQAAAAWDSPWGRGRPGWHLECSVMSVTELGETLDMHLGGEDLVFPHHENEIAQSEAATGKPFVRHWLHVKHLLVDGKKMSKSLGNFVTVRELLERGYDAASIRHQLISAQYRRELNFTIAGLDASKNAVQRLLDFERRLVDAPVAGDAGPSVLPEAAERALSGFRRAMDDDFNSADAMGALFVLVTEVNAELDRAGAVRPNERDAVLDALRSMDQVLGLLEVAHRDRTVDDELGAWVEGKIQERKEARNARDFATADAIRDELAGRGIVLEDGPEGTRWKVVK